MLLLGDEGSLRVVNRTHYFGNEPAHDSFAPVADRWCRLMRTIDLRYPRLMRLRNELSRS